MSFLVDFGAAALRMLPAEPAHELALAGLRAGLGSRFDGGGVPALATEVAGLTLPNPLGLAAGFDKNAACPDPLLRAGFGFVECGTVTPLPQAGNPRPRLFRLREDGAVINRMGFNNAGLDTFAARLAARQGRPGVVGANIGANKDSPDRIADYVTGLKRVWPFASYITINISSPNTPGLRGLQERGALEDLLGAVAGARADAVRTAANRPVFLKVAPDLDEQAVRDIAELAQQWKVDALIVSNTTIERPATLQGVLKREAGGLSGKPLFQKSTQILRLFAEAVDGRLPLVGVGGVDGAPAALSKIRAGASAVQLYTALAYRGPGLVRSILIDLAALLAAEGFGTLREAIGADLRRKPAAAR